MTGVIKSVAVVANRAAINYKLTITVNTVDTDYTINGINLIQLLKAVGEYPSTDVANDLEDMEISFNADTFNRISNVSLIEVSETTSDAAQF